MHVYTNSSTINTDAQIDNIEKAQCHLKNACLLTQALSRLLLLKAILLGQSRGDNSTKSVDIKNSLLGWGSNHVIVSIANSVSSAKQVALSRIQIHA